MGPILLKKQLILMNKKHKITNKNIKGVKSQKRYKRGFAIRTWKIINLLSKTDDFINSEKIKVFPLVCSKYLSSWTGPDMTEVRVLVQFRTLRIQN